MHFFLLEMPVRLAESTQKKKTTQKKPNEECVGVGKRAGRLQGKENIPSPFVIGKHEREPG